MLQEIETPGPLDLAVERERQAMSYTDLGLHELLSMSAEAYLDSLPRIDEQPKQFFGRFDIPVIVDPRFSIEDLCDGTGINNYIQHRNFHDSYATPYTPYVLWMNDGLKYYEQSPAAAHAQFARDESRTTIGQGISLYIAHPDILLDHYLIFSGTTVEPRYIASLDILGGPRLIDSWGGGVQLDFALVSHGKI